MGKDTYKIVTFSERIRLIDLHHVRKSGLCDIVYKKRVPVVPTEPDILITENGYLHYRKKEGRIFSCVLTEREQMLVGAILAAPEQILDDAFAVFQWDIWKNRDKTAMTNIIGSLNRKMNKENVPLKIVRNEWRLQISHF